VTSVADTAPAVTSVADTAPAVTSVADTAPAVTSVADTAPAVTSVADTAPAVTSPVGGIKKADNVTILDGVGPLTNLTSFERAVLLFNRIKDDKVRLEFAGNFFSTSISPARFEEIFDLSSSKPRRTNCDVIASFIKILSTCPSADTPVYLAHLNKLLENQRSLAFMLTKDEKLLFSKMAAGCGCGELAWGWKL
jgi:hypothetical protein